MSNVDLHLKPSPGFCIKSTTVQQTSIKIQDQVVPVPVGLKVFLNIAWDTAVPPPPDAKEEIIRRALQGEEENKNSLDAWYVPVVVSEGRKDVDKAGKPALVFDCVYNASLKTRSLAYSEFKVFLVELALQRVEVQTSLTLSRQIGSPNIRSKGNLTPRTVRIPQEIFARLGASKTPDPELAAAPVSQKPLIRDITTERTTRSPSSFDGKLKGILKSGSSAKSTVLSPIWKWSKEGDKLRITIAVPNLTHDLIKSSTLDIEPQRLILSIPGRSAVDINLNLSDAEIVSLTSSLTPDAPSLQESDLDPNKTLMLKRQRDFDVDGARAEWRVADGVLIVCL